MGISLVMLGFPFWFARFHELLSTCGVTHGLIGGDITITASVGPTTLFYSQPVARELAFEIRQSAIDN